ncbi:MAG: aminotransferase class I/II-fold pyridoxal phosphate-dependent enzyme [Bdellovibrionales bacterium]|nr:aminotransferase class I/II-fold pyridoxal phosphate-dependent enzyme [Bdellovibrionales bacterium]
MGATPVSQMAGSLIGSEVLRIAGEINALQASGKSVLNFTVGDFNPQYFPIPESLQTRIIAAYQKNETNYPPSSGATPLRQAVADFYSREFDVPTGADEVLIAGGARPLIYTTFRALVDAGDTVIYPAPSWNNNHYCHMSQAKGQVIACWPEAGFLPTAADIEPFVAKASLLCLNSPLNPTGTMFSARALQEICELVLKENQRRGPSAKPLYLMFDQIYWKLSLAGAEHQHPLRLCPDIKPYTVFIDGISKYFCGTGLRVGWAVMPKNLMGPFSSLLGHIGAWAPKPEQLATAQFLNDRSALDAFTHTTRAQIEQRLFPLFEGIQKLKAEGLPVDAVKPQGGIYLSVKFGLKNNPRATDEDIRRALLEQLGIAVVPFQAFGLQQDSGWFRMSVGAVSAADVLECVARLKRL